MKKLTQSYADWRKELNLLAKRRSATRKLLKQIWEPELINFYGDGVTPHETFNTLQNVSTHQT